MSRRTLAISIGRAALDHLGVDAKAPAPRLHVDGDLARAHRRQDVGRFLVAHDAAQADLGRRARGHHDLHPVVEDAQDVELGARPADFALLDAGDLAHAVGRVDGLVADLEVGGGRTRQRGPCEEGAPARPGRKDGLWAEGRGRRRRRRPRGVVREASRAAWIGISQGTSRRPGRAHGRGGGTEAAGRVMRAAARGGSDVRGVRYHRQRAGVNERQGRAIRKP